jgi:serine-aspartate repeat-containing protein C/D/E
VGFLSKWLRGDDAHSQPSSVARSILKRRCRIEKLQDRRPMAADIHLGAVYYEDTTDGEDQSPDVIEISWTGGPAGAELKSLTINMDKNNNGVLDPGETFFDTAGTNFGVGQFGNSDLQLIGNGFQILSATTIGGISGNWDGATSIVLTFSGFTVGKTLLIKADIDEAGFMGSASAIVEGDEFQYSQMTGTFAAPHYKNATGTASFFDAYPNSAADQVGLPRDDYNVPPGLPVPVRTAGAFLNLEPEPYASIRGNVHVDYDGDCITDPGEPLLQGVTIQLLDANGNVIRTTQTDVNGNYEFLDLDAGTYSVREIQPAQYFSHAALAGTIGGTKVGTGGTNDLITGIQLTAGAQAIDYNFCEGIGQISGRVHAENDGDGVYETGEKLIEGVTIELLDSTGNVIATTTTDANGEYLFDRLLKGTYSVREVQPTLYFDSMDKVGTVGGVSSGSITVNDRIDNIQLVAASKGIRYDFVEKYGSISGFVLDDRNGDCIKQANENGIAGVRMDLRDAAGNVVATTFTDTNGNYKFDMLTRGTYTVFEHQPTGYLDSGDHVGTIDGVLTGTRSADDTLSEIALLAGADGINYNFCEVLPASIGGRVHADANGDCIYQPTEVLIAGVKMELLDAAGNVVATTFTDALGQYKFDNLRPGTYSVRETQPSLYFDSGDHVGTVNGVLNGTTTVNDRLDAIVLTAGQQGINYNFCEKYGSISGFVLDDRNGDCVKQDNENGIAGVKMELLNESGQVVATTFTDADGNYKFEMLTRGTYTVREIQPKGYFDSGDHIGTIDGVLTGFYAANDVIAGIVLQSFPDGIKYNFCENLPASLGGVVFQDGPTIVIADGTTQITDVLAQISQIRDGRLTGDDTRLAGVTLRLFRADGQPIFDVNGNLVEFTTTDANGQYLFTGLRAGEYYVAEVQPAGFYDSIDTPGTTGGFVVMPDTIAKITLGWGQTSQQNNFSEVKITNPPFRYELDPPPPPPQVNAVIPPANPAAPSPNPITYNNPNGIDQYGNGVVGYTWHLSVVNGGKPRTSRLTQSQMVASTREIEEINALRPDWRTETVKQGLFRLRTGEDDEPSVREIKFGLTRATPVVGDFNGDGSTDVGVFKDGSWYVDLNGNGEWDEADLWAKLGRQGDLPITGDWDGDGKVDIAIFGKAWPGDPRHIAFDPGLPSDENAKHEKVKNVPPLAGEATLGVRAMQLTSTGSVRSDLIDHVFLYGWGGDQPISGDWTGEGQEMIGIFRNGNWQLDLTGDGKYTAEDRSFQMGEKGDKPVVGDFDGDTIADVGIYRDGLWHIDTNHDGVLDQRDRAFTFGDANDLPVVGDWDGDGIDDPGLYRDIKNTAQK